MRPMDNERGTAYTVNREVGKFSELLPIVVNVGLAPGIFPHGPDKAGEEAHLVWIFWCGFDLSIDLFGAEDGFLLDEFVQGLFWEHF